MYAAITVLESLGHCIGDPSMQQILAASLRLSPFWQALPFFVGSVSFLVAQIRLIINDLQGFYFLAVISTTFIKIDT